MAKNYLSILKREGRTFCASPGGWYIRCGWEEYKDYRTGEMAGREYINVPRGCPAATRKDFRRSLAMDNRIARSVNTKEEYRALWKRIDSHDWDYIIEHDLKGSSLISWAYGTHTSKEYHDLLWYN